MKKQPEKLKREELKKILDKQNISLEKMKLELKIEASLETVRAVSLVMKKREDMLQVCTTIAKQLQLLHVKEIRNVQTAIFYKEKDTYFNYEYYARHDKTFVTETTYTNHKIQQEFGEKMLKGNGEFMEAHIKGDKLKEWLAYQKTTNVFIDDYLNTASSLNYYWFSLGPVALGISTYSPLNKKEISLFKRFLKVFELSYRRYIDIEKAEAQAREAQLETALERVRSRSMAMHKSEELKEVIRLVLEQFGHLKINAAHAGFYIDYKAHDDMHIWLADPNIEPFFAVIPYFDSPTWNSFVDAKATGKIFFTNLLDFDEKNKFYTSLFKLFTIPEKAQKFYLQCKGLAVSTVLLDNVGLYIENFDAIPYTDEENAVVIRFGKVFQQTYTRFLDLQKAEAQTRESQIELSLERVRAKTMAMHNSQHLAETVVTLFDELVKLGIDKTTRTGIAIIGDKNDMEIWTASSNANGEISLDIGRVDLMIHPMIKGFYQSWKNRETNYRYEFLGEDLKNYFTAINNSPDYPVQFDLASLPSTLIHSSFFFPEGALYAFSPQPLKEEASQIFKRFAGVFGQTYRRYLDLKKAEVQAREARIETALERVRSRTMSMQRSGELAETAAVLFNQLVLLGIEPNRLYIGIIKDDNGHIEFWATDEEGIKVNTQFIGDASRNASMKKMYDAWKAGKSSLMIDMQGKELSDYFQYMADELRVPFTTGLSQKRRIQNIAIFAKGFLGIASPDEQPEETSQLLERFAAVFNLTYTRFNDLKIAEAHALQAEQDLIAIKEAKQKAEEALTELQVTQKQLIQSEKMASLGELTAGIAHEIQNPLNFVNNFSEVNKELVDELQTELKSGNVDEAIAISNDIKDNSGKINHHGKRADAIVKGMLQHSRSTTDVKEETDINKLADEYLRLAYHGLRAKDNSFNATLKSDFSNSIEKINIIPQDIGRVLLNLFTNAFYAVNDKKKNADENYQPTISVQTKKMNNNVEIKVSDNGNGIPSNIINKIFQPFFTTKPTGQGTGLGLSLTYDIVKAHGGDIRVQSRTAESNEGNTGTDFIIELPSL